MTRQDLNTGDIEHSESKDDLGFFVSAPAAIGRKLADRWVIVEALGEGNLSSVYKAEEESTKKVVALKQIHQQLLKNVSNLTRLEQRARVLIALNHEHIANFYDINITSAKEVFLFCDYFPSENLEEILSKVGHIDVERAAKIFKQAADGLDYAHKQKTLHRDLKPSNICIVNDQYSVDDVRIVDFGIARLLVEEAQDTKSGRFTTQSREVFGSSLYISPEQAAGKKVDGRADIYALGCVMFECINGKPPFVGKNVMETSYRHMHEAPPPLVSPTLPATRAFERYQAIVNKALQKKPDRRYQTMSELRADLDMMLDANDNKWQTTAYCLRGSTKRSLKEIVSERIPWGIIAAVTGVLLLLCIIAYWAFVLLTTGDESSDYPHFDNRHVWVQTEKKSTSTVEDFSTKRENARIELESIEQEKGRNSKEYEKSLAELCDLFLKAGRWADAAVQLKQLLEIHNAAHGGASPVSVKTELAHCYFMQNENEAAEKEAQAIAKIEPANRIEYLDKMRALTILGDIYTQRDDDKNALDIYLKLFALANAHKMQIPAEYARAAARLGDTYRRLHDLSDAQKYYDDALFMWTNHVSHWGELLSRLYFSYALIFAENKQYEKAQEMLRRALPSAVHFDGARSAFVGAIRKEYLDNVYHMDFVAWLKLKMKPETDPMLAPPPPAAPPASSTVPILP